MTKTQCKAAMNKRLRTVLVEYHATSGVSQERLADWLGISSRACSALENGEYGFSPLSIFALFALLPFRRRITLLGELCDIVRRAFQHAA